MAGIWIVFPTSMDDQNVKITSIERSNIIDDQNEKITNTDRSNIIDEQNEEITSTDRSNIMNTTDMSREDTNNDCELGTYPDRVITDLIKNNNTVAKWFNIKDIRTEHTEEIVDNICDTNTRYFPLRAAKNKAGRFLFIVNSPEGSEEYIQLVKVTTCTNAGEQCAQGQLSGVMTTMCRQEYSDHKLVALSETGKELVVDTFSLPSCCSCVIDSSLQLRTSNSPQRQKSFC